MIFERGKRKQIRRCGLVVQHPHGKGETTGSIPVTGSMLQIPTKKANVFCLSRSLPTKKRSQGRSIGTAFPDRRLISFPVFLWTNFNLCSISASCTDDTFETWRRPISMRCDAHARAFSPCPEPGHFPTARSSGWNNGFFSDRSTLAGLRRRFARSIET